MPQNVIAPDITMRLGEIEKSMQALQTEMIHNSGDKNTTMVKFGALEFLSISDAADFVKKIPVH